MNSLQRLLVASSGLVAGAVLLLTVHTGSLSAYIAYGLSLSWVVTGSLWLIIPNYRRLPQLSCVLGLIGLVLAPLALIQLTPINALLMAMLACVVMLTAGLGSIWRFELPALIPTPKATLLLAFKVVLDELVMGYFVSSLRFPRGQAKASSIAESQAMLRLIQQKGWDSRPALAHPEPVLPVDVTLNVARYKTRVYERLEFSSSFPDPGLPGSPRWMSQPQVVRARIFEHAGGARPWLMCIHGYRMGWLPLDFQLFPPGWLHNKLGFNLIMPILPLHGSRRQGWRSGDGLFDGNGTQTIHAVLQGVHDMRCLLAWLREAKGTRDVGVLGYSLGGFHASLLASLESELSSVIAAIPLVDVPAAMLANAPRHYLEALHKAGLGVAELKQLFAVISPLAFQPRLSVEKLAVTAGAADRIVPVEPVCELIAHWQQESPLWFAGSHLSVRREAVVKAWLCQQWQATGLLHSDLNPEPQAG